ncbi:uncharacterized protein CMU_037500 [Cryptosporidium muris RN66]|uniref:Uncharacterized protein n=1 Tax=Cryptosporidium muris (strain RN66) TaxID=441375 RepID=B6AH85_CRYMR|nr:uncharacterized protein CMU_037500 [Cryptosporidium muris RN66]EEA07576.1 hypothetical protein CMU_037500 [Cryptosporidium muris RN66]|eukprot:XP_002141925.1 hypothetical protein [Cryptosporidium muris RN66]
MYYYVGVYISPTHTMPNRYTMFLSINIESDASSIIGITKKRRFQGYSFKKTKESEEDLCEPLNANHSIINKLPYFIKKKLINGKWRNSVKNKAQGFKLSNKGPKTIDKNTTQADTTLSNELIYEKVSLLDYSLSEFREQKSVTENNIEKDSLYINDTTNIFSETLFKTLKLYNLQSKPSKSPFHKGYNNSTNIKPKYKKIPTKDLSDNVFKNEIIQMIYFRSLLEDNNINEVSKYEELPVSLLLIILRT